MYMYYIVNFLFWIGKIFFVIFFYLKVIIVEFGREVLFSYFLRKL